MLAALQLPDVDSAIVPTTGQRAAIGTHLERLACPLVRLARLHALSALDIPPAQHSVAATADQHRAGRTPGHCIHDPRMPRQDPYALQASHIPHEQLLVVSAPSARAQPLPITAPAHVVHFALMSS